MPKQWKTAVIHPIPKVPDPTSPSDYRPISVVPILSRLVEKVIVRTYIYPAFQITPTAENLADQYGFRPSGSTTAAIIALLHHITSLLLEHEFVIMVSMDFSKAFDTVRHHSLLKKLGTIDIPDHIFNWLTNYFYDRKHITKFQGEVSSVASINASVVQVSGVGPGSYVVGSSDLHPKNSFNILLKYAHDTYLLVGSSNIGTVDDEYQHVASWAKNNNLKLNPSKTREIIFSKRGVKGSSIPTVIQGAERVETIKVLGITLSSDLRMTKHTQIVLASCSTYALRVLRDHGMTINALHEVAMATTVAHLMYASPSWWGYVSEADKNKFQIMINKMKRRGFLLSNTLMLLICLRLLISVYFGLFVLILIMFLEEYFQILSKLNTICVLGFIILIFQSIISATIGLYHAYCLKTRIN